MSFWEKYTKDMKNCKECGVKIDWDIIPWTIGFLKEEKTKSKFYNCECGNKCGFVHYLENPFVDSSQHNEGF